MRPQGLIFDLDGTLVDSMNVWKKIDIQYLNKFGLQLPDDLQQEIEGYSFTQTAEYFKKRFQIPDSVEEIKKDWNRMVMNIYSNEVALKKGARALLERAEQNKIPCAIATSNSIELVQAVLRSNGVEKYFNAIVTGCDVGKSKPEPDVYLEAARRLKVTSAECLVFEDILAGIAGAHNAGMQVVAISDAYSEYQEEDKKKNADYYVKDFEEFLQTYPDFL